MTCEVKWCAGDTVAGSTFCAVHRDYPTYDPSQRNKGVPKCRASGCNTNAAPRDELCSTHRAAVNENPESVPMKAQKKKG